MILVITGIVRRSLYNSAVSTVHLSDGSGSDLIYDYCSYKLKKLSIYSERAYLCTREKVFKVRVGTLLGKTTLLLDPEAGSGKRYERSGPVPKYSLLLDLL
jgi:hypothetical protein